MKKTNRLSGLILIALIITVATFAFAAGITMPTTTAAGDGSMTISGYTISNIDYVLNGTNPGQIDSVTFDITPTAVDTIQIQLVASGSWYSCTDDNAGNVTCTTTGATAASVDNLRVVATD